MGHTRALRIILSTGLLIASVLLIRFAIDLSAQMPLLSAPFWLLVLASLSVIGWSVFAQRRVENEKPLTDAARAFFLAAIPVAFIVSSLGCTGLTLKGCSPFCTFIKLVWTPLMATIGAVYFFNEKPALLISILLMSFVPLAPHCVCYNAANGWWIDQMGYSPECFIWGFTVSLIAIGAIGRIVRQSVASAISLSIIAGGFIFFIGHHYFQFPW